MSTRGRKKSVRVLQEEELYLSDCLQDLTLANINVLESIEELTKLSRELTSKYNQLKSTIIELVQYYHANGANSDASELSESLNTHKKSYRSQMRLVRSRRELLGDLCVSEVDIASTIEDMSQVSVADKVSDFIKENFSHSSAVKHSPTSDYALCASAIIHDDQCNDIEHILSVSSSDDIVTGTDNLVLGHQITGSLVGNNRVNQDSISVFPSRISQPCSESVINPNNVYPMFKVPDSSCVINNGSPNQLCSINTCLRLFNQLILMVMLPVNKM